LKRLSVQIALIFMMAVAAPDPLAAQTSTARVSGRVSDTTGAALPGASVVVMSRSQQNNFLLDGTQNTDGDVNAYVISPSANAKVTSPGRTGMRPSATLCVLSSVTTCPASTDMGARRGSARTCDFDRSTHRASPAAAARKYYTVATGASHARELGPLHFSAENRATAPATGPSTRRTMR